MEPLENAAIKDCKGQPANLLRGFHDRWFGSSLGSLAEEVELGMQKASMRLCDLLRTRIISVR